MRSNRVKIGSFVEPVSQKCGIAQCDTVSGINIFKRFMPSRNFGTDTSDYLVVPPGHFAFNLMHVGRDERIPVAFNDSDTAVIVSPAYFVFKVSEQEVVCGEYLYVLMSSPEFDRYAWFCTDSSIRGNLDWDRFCEIEIEVPPCPIQQKYVAVYRAMLANQRAYEHGLDDLKLTCDAFLDKLRRALPHVAVADYVEQSDTRNTLGLGPDSVRGLATSKELVPTKANLHGVQLSNYRVMPPNYIAYVPDTSRRGDRISLAMNSTTETYLVSSISTVFRTYADKLLPSYLMMFLSRPEFDRYARFHSWGSAREAFSWADMQKVTIPIPDIDVQQAIVDIYSTFLTRRHMSEKLRSQIKDVCPLLIKGSLEEAKAWR